MGAALKHAFDVLNINRMQTGIDTYGQGRCPFYLEPSVIVVITDGGKLSSNAGIQEEVSLSVIILGNIQKYLHHFSARNFEFKCDGIGSAIFKRTHLFRDFLLYFVVT